VVFSTDISSSARVIFAASQSKKEESVQRESWRRLAVEGWAFVLIAVIAFLGGLLIGKLGGSTTTETVYVGAPSSNAQSEGTGPSETASADGQQLFTSVGCGSCHTMAAAGATGKVGPDLEESLAPDDNTAGIEEMIVHPNSEVVEGYSPNVMPQTYGQTVSGEEVSALAEFIVANSAAKP
jgi:mono/diheme cytochrome c family protein